MQGIRIGLSRTEWIENVDERTRADSFYTEIFVDFLGLGSPFSKLLFIAAKMNRHYLCMTSPFSMW